MMRETFSNLQTRRRHGVAREFIHRCAGCQWIGSIGGLAGGPGGGEVGQCGD
jgi:hypothetical protein